jgi:4-amino-4-deoxy-L-arabinose transferase-like glycosyltransferase
MRASHLPLLLVILLIGAGLRFHGLARDVRFHPDEAWFSTFARRAALNGDWLLRGDLDKPPLALYASALSMTFVAAQTNGKNVLDFTWRQGEFAARLPNTLAGIIFIAAMYRLARAVYPDRRLAIWVALFAALSPFAVAYSPTAFTDGLMLPLVTLALWMGAARRWGWAGVWLALAFAAKPQALYALPLLGMLALLPRLEQPSRQTPYPSPSRRGMNAVFHFLLPLVVVALLLVIWDSARGGAGVWALAAANNNPARLIRSDEVWPRLGEWAVYGAGLLGSPSALFALALPLALFAQVRADWRTKFYRRSTLVNLLLLAYLLAYLLLHWLVAFNVYDRYLLLIVPPALLLAIQTGVWAWGTLRRFLSRPEVTIAAGAVVISLLSSAWAASNGTAYDAVQASAERSYAGIPALAAFLNEREFGAIVYDHWLGWPLGYYLGEWTDKRRVYYPTPAALASDAPLNPETAPRYFVAPTDRNADPWLEALDSAGFTSTEVYRAGGFVVWELRR